MARAAAALFWDMGALGSNRYVEAQRSDLVAGFKGQTESKTAEVVKGAGATLKKVASFSCLG